jgi:hypothetical protein
MFTRSSFFIAAICLGATINASGRQFTNRQRENNVSWPYHPNRLGVEAYMQGGAFVSKTGSVTSLLFNPAGIAQSPGRLVATVETGWASETDYLRFFKVNFASAFQPVQFAAVVFQPWPKLSVGAYYARPTHYDLEMGPIAIATVDHPEGTGETFAPILKREQTSLGLALAAPLGKHFYFGGGVEWRRANIRDEIYTSFTEGDAEAVRFSAGAILQIDEWNIGISAQTKYKASGDITFNTPLSTNIDLDPDLRGNNNFLIIRPEPFRFSIQDPASIRFGIATPYAFGRLRLSVDAEYKDFNDDAPIERWQVYGGGAFDLFSNVHLGFGLFTFAKDYSAFIDGPESETFLTLGGSIELAQLRLSASFMDGDILNQDFKGQRIINFAVGYMMH